MFIFINILLCVTLVKKLVLTDPLVQEPPTGLQPDKMFPCIPCCAKLWPYTLVYIYIYHVLQPCLCVTSCCSVRSLCHVHPMVAFIFVCHLPLTVPLCTCGQQVVSLLSLTHGHISCSVFAQVPIPPDAANCEHLLLLPASAAGIQTPWPECLLQCRTEPRHVHVGMWSTGCVTCCG